MHFNLHDAEKMFKINQIQYYAMSRRGEYAAWSIAIIFVLLTLSKFYNTITLLVAKPTLSNNQTELLSLNHQTQNINLSSLHLFGLYQANINPSQLPKSTLNIQLNGVFMATPAKLSQAVLTVPGAAQKIYYTGDELPGNAKLYRILSNSVIIQYDGEFQSLTLPEPKIEFSNRPPAALNFPTSTRIDLTTNRSGR